MLCRVTDSFAENVTVCVRFSTVIVVLSEAVGTAVCDRDAETDRERDALTEPDSDGDAVVEVVMLCEWVSLRVVVKSGVCVGERDLDIVKD